MDAEAILSALASFASTWVFGDPLPTPTLAALANLAAAPSTTAAPASGQDDTSHRIYAALVANAALSSPLLPSSLTPPIKLSALAASSPSGAVAAASTAPVGFLTSRLSALPSAVQILLGVYLLLLGLFLLTCGSRALFWGREWGRKRGEEGRGWLGGGMGGVLVGSAVVGTFSAFLVLAIVASQSSPFLGAWPTLAIIFVPSLVGAVIGGRWEWAARISYAVLGSLSFSLLLTLSLHLSHPLPRALLLLFPLLLSLSLLLIPFLRTRTQRFALPALSALSGALLFVLSIDVFPAVQLGVVDALGLLIAANGVGAESGKEVGEVVVWWDEGGVKGLVAAWWIASVVGAVGMGVWGLGIDGDESWNTYLAHLISQHPSTPSGTHLPPLTFFQRAKAFFSRSPGGAPLTELPSRRVTPWDEDDEEDDEFDLEKGGSMRSPRHRHHDHHHPSSSSFPSLAPHRSRHSAHSHGHDTSDAWDSDVETLFSPSFPPPHGSKAQAQARVMSPTSVRSKAFKASAPAKYGALSFSHSDDDEADENPAPDGLWTAAGGKGSMDAPRRVRPPLARMETAESSGTGKESVRSAGSGLSGSTAVGSAKGVAKRIEEAEEDEDEDVVAALPVLAKRHDPDTASTKSSKVKDGLKRFLPSSSRSPSSFSSSSSSKPASYPSAPTSTSSSASPPPPPAHSVPATPSLLLALDRVRLAQQQARQAQPRRVTPLTRRESLKVAGEGEKEGEGSGGGAPLERRKSMDEWWGEVVKKSEGR
ncbi:hypothetical protein JCM6882_005855 [Rhodosporidiobolus microsporus]